MDGHGKRESKVVIVMSFALKMVEQEEVKANKFGCVTKMD